MALKASKPESIGARATKGKILPNLKKRSIARIVFEGASFETKIYEDSASYSSSINMAKIFNPCNDIITLASEKAIHEESLPMHEQPFIIVQVRVPPTNGDFERSVEVVVQPFKVIYDPCLILDLVDLHYMLDSFQFQHERVLSSLNGFENRKVRLLSKLE
ncbi:hypothetical protein QJS10_CPA10g00689 [Acorus calamus]|uniref:Uncharacterized protein n=1 Tax=Acorus calamus TaxID=4465 RepID=A0AAV9E003_ACOCL|nr:hypothetical protein QJS10_CPA10g00689 [Acorus calamus]